MENVKLMLKNDIVVLAPFNRNYCKSQRGCNVNVQLTKKGKFVVTKFFGKGGYTVARKILYNNKDFGIKFCYQNNVFEHLNFKSRTELEHFIKDIELMDTMTKLVFVSERLYTTVGQ